MASPIEIYFIYEQLSSFIAHFYPNFHIWVSTEEVIVFDKYITLVNKYIFLRLHGSVL